MTNTDPTGARLAALVTAAHVMRAAAYAAGVAAPRVTAEDRRASIRAQIAADADVLAFHVAVDALAGALSAATPTPAPDRPEPDA